MNGKAEADRFIAEHIRQYGLVGTNVTMNPSKGFTQVPTRLPAFTRDNHFVYGYNGSTFNCRDSSTCMYFTDYIHQPKRQTNLYEELEFAAAEMADVYGKFGIKLTGSPLQYALADACRRIGADFFQIVTVHPWLDDEPFYPYDGRNPTIKVTIEDQAMKDLVPEVVQVTRSTCSGTLLRAMLTRHFENPIVWGRGLVFDNMHHDDNESIGPEHWVLVDEERETALCRWMMYEGKVGCHELAVWSPDIIRAQLVPSNYFFAKSGGRTQQDWIDHYFYGVWAPLSPCMLNMDHPRLYEWQDMLEGWMKEEHDGGKHNEKWLTPVATLYRSLGIDPPFDLGVDIEDIYGAVL